VTETPKISVLIPTYNGAATLGKSLQSIAQQTERDFEVVVVDDGSTDESVKVVESIDDARIRLLRHSTNKGLESTRNELMAQARGRYIAWLDQDDHAAPTRLARQVEFLDKFPDLGACGTWALASTERENSGRKVPSRRYRYVVNPHYLRFWQLFENQIATSSCMMRSTAAIGFEFETGLAPTEDWAFWNELGHKSGLANIPEFLTTLALNSDTYSARAKTRQEKGWDVVWQRGFHRLGLNLTRADLAAHRLLTYGSRNISSDFDPQVVRVWCMKLFDWALTLNKTDRHDFVEVMHYFMSRFEWRIRGRRISLFESRSRAFYAATNSARLLLGQKSPLAKVLN